MRYLGLTTFFTVIILSISIGSLYLTVIERRIYEQAHKFSVNDNGNVDPERKATFLKKQKNKKFSIIPGMAPFTLEQIKKNSLKLGSGFRGGIRKKVSVDLVHHTLKLAESNKNFKVLVIALENIQQNSYENPEAFIKELLKQFVKLKPKKPIEKILTHHTFQAKLGGNPTREQIIKAFVQTVKEATEANVRIYTHRLNRLGVSSVTIAVNADFEIEIEAPGYDDTDRQRLEKMIESIGKFVTYEVAILNETQKKNFIVAWDHEIQKEQPGTPKLKDMIISVPEGIICKQEHEPFLAKFLQENSQIKSALPIGVIPIMDAKPRQIEQENYYVINFAQITKPILEGSEIKRASMGHHAQTGYFVELNANSIGAKKLRRYTADDRNTGKLIMMVFDNRAYSVAEVRDEIPDGKCQITGGNMSQEDAKELATTAGLEETSSVKNIEQTIMGPSLGKPAQDQALNTLLIALIILMLLMIAYYGIAGIISSLVLIVNAIIILGVLAQIHAVLTLADLAAFVLTLGTGIDGNIIINEQIGAHLKKGQTLKSSINKGYSQSYSSIIDANFTTLIGAVVLYIWGKGAVKGFATTLTIGTISSCFTSVLVSRIITEGVQRILIPQRFSFSLLKKYIKND